MDTPIFDKKVWKQNMGFVIITAKYISKNTANMRGLWKLGDVDFKSWHDFKSPPPPKKKDGKNK